MANYTGNSITKKGEVMALSKKQLDFSNLKALFINCTLKRSPEMSHTDGLLAISKAIQVVVLILIIQIIGNN